MPITIVDKKEFTWDKQYTWDSSISFFYPEFMDWEVASIEQQEGGTDKVIIFFHYPDTIDLESTPSAIISKEHKLAKLPENTPINPHGIYYYGYAPNKTNELNFQLPTYSVNIQLFAGNEKQGFSSKKFFEEIIKTFKLEK